MNAAFGLLDELPREAWPEVGGKARKPGKKEKRELAEDARQALLFIGPHGLIVTNIGSSGEDGVRVLNPEFEGFGLRSDHEDWIELGRTIWKKITDPLNTPTGAFIEMTSTAVSVFRASRAFSDGLTATTRSDSSSTDRSRAASLRRAAGVNGSS